MLGPTSERLFCSVEVFQKECLNFVQLFLVFNPACSPGIYKKFIQVE